MRNYLIIILLLLIFLIDSALGKTPATTTEIIVQYKYMVYIIAVAAVAILGGLFQSKLSKKGLSSISKVPGSSDKLFVPMILALALIESLVIITFVSVFLTK